MGLAAIFKDAFAQVSLRSFMVILFLVILVSGVTRTFVVVYAREVFEHNDGLILLYSVFGGLGYLIAGLSVKFLVDRLGAKPLFLVCVILGLVSMIPIIFLPVSAVFNVTGAILFLVFLFFMLNFGFLGSEGIAQTYFLALIPQDKILDLGIVYFFVFGAAGAGGSFLAGLLLDFFSFLGISPFVSFKILFIILITLTVIALAMQKRMKSLGSFPLRGALEVIFSFKDLRAISLLDRLNKAEDSQEEELLLGALHDTPSRLAVDGLLERARSPRLAIRLEAVRALERMEKLNEKAQAALIDDVKNNPYTTAYISARILGNHNCKNAVPLLREHAVSDDYMLAGEAVIALAKLSDESFRPEIEKIVLQTKNPRLKIMCAEALGQYHSVDSISILFDILRSENPPPYLGDEVILAIASILNVQRAFYKILARYKADNSLVSALATDETDSALEFVNTNVGGKKRLLKEKVNNIISCAENLQSAAGKYIAGNDGADFSRWILELPEINKNAGLVKSIFSEAVVDKDLGVYDCLRLLIVHWAAEEMRIWAMKVK